MHAGYMYYVLVLASCSRRSKLAHVFMVLFMVDDIFLIFFLTWSNNQTVLVILCIIIITLDGLLLVNAKRF
jgi:hypothetical protein